MSTSARLLRLQESKADYKTSFTRKGRWSKNNPTHLHLDGRFIHLLRKGKARLCRDQEARGLWEALWKEGLEVAGDDAIKDALHRTARTIRGPCLADDEAGLGRQEVTAPVLNVV